MLNYRLSAIIAAMGRTDLDVPGAVAQELPVERIVVASELMERNSELASEFAFIVPSASVEHVADEEFKRHTARAKAVAWANVRHMRTLSW